MQHYYFNVSGALVISYLSNQGGKIMVNIMLEPERLHYKLEQNWQNEDGSNIILAQQNDGEEIQTIDQAINKVQYLRLEDDSSMAFPNLNKADLDDQNSSGGDQSNDEGLSHEERVFARRQRYENNQEVKKLYQDFNDSVKDQPGVGRHSYENEAQVSQRSIDFNGGDSLELNSNLIRTQMGTSRKHNYKIMYHYII